MGHLRWSLSITSLLAMIACNSVAGLDDLTFEGAGGAATGGGAGVGGATTTSTGGSGGTGGGTGAAGGSAGGGGNGPLSYAEEVLSDDPVAYWRLDDAGPLAMDTSPSGYDGVFAGNVKPGAPGLIKGDPNTAVELDGVNARIDMGDVLDFPGNAPYTLEAWVMPLSFPDTFEAGICSKRSVDATQGFSLRIRSSPVTGTAELIHFLDGAADGAEGVTPVELGSVFHLVGVFDGTAIRLYRNGVEDASDATGIPTLTDNDGSFIIGVDDATQYFHGVVDEVAVYATALSPTRIAEHYLAGAP